ncbi:hypothetical protein [Elizabethkingia meningoseptica]|uniref:hypothetical protein n=1 Tax=Elizabethkingia meningoseptica TaxID=238 RepID=UPI0023B10F39|nr:hypothetical protein [Elizabethkingia meningoseptica]MDE5526640.1 hypothetical protein [Elizabethkingia meningoseptica]
MTAKDKAEELVKKYFDLLTFKSDYKNVKETNSRANVIFRNMSIECAIISVNEILDLCEKEFDTSIYSPADYWQEVKSELEKLKG